MDNINIISSRLIPICHFGRAENYIFAAGGGLAKNYLSLDEVKSMLLVDGRDKVLPSHCFDREDFEDLALWVAQEKLPNVFFQISAPNEILVFSEKVRFLWSLGLHIDVLFQSLSDIKKVQPLFATDRPFVRWIYLVNKLYGPETISDFKPAMFDKFFFSFLPSNDVKDIYLTPQEIPADLKKISQLPFLLEAKLNVLILEELETVQGNPTSTNKILHKLCLSEIQNTVSVAPSRRISREAPLKLADFSIRIFLYILRDFLRMFLYPVPFFKEKYYQARHLVLYSYHLSRHLFMHLYFRTRDLAMRLRWILIKSYYICKSCMTAFGYQFQRIIFLPWHYRHIVFFPFYKVYWILEHRYKWGKHARD